MKRALTLLGLAMAMAAQPSPDQFEYDEFTTRWNAVAREWNAAAVELQAGKYPLGRLQRLEKEFEKLRRSRLWPKAKEK